MKLTTKQLKRMIQEELKEAYKLDKGQSWMVGAGSTRTRARKKAGIDPETMSMIKDIEGAEPEQAAMLAQDLGSEEHEPVNLNWKQAKPFILADIKKAVTKTYSDWKNNHPYEKLVPIVDVQMNLLPIRNPIVKKYQPNVHKAITKSGWPSNFADAEMVAFIENNISMATDRALEAMGLDYKWWEPEPEYQEDVFGQEELMEMIQEELLEMERPSYWNKDAVALDPERQKRQKEAGFDQETIDKLADLAKTDPRASYDLSDTLGSEEGHPLTLADFDPLPDDLLDGFGFDDEDDDYVDWDDEDYP